MEHCIRSNQRQVKAKEIDRRFDFGDCMLHQGPGTSSGNTGVLGSSRPGKNLAEAFDQQILEEGVLVRSK